MCKHRDLRPTLEPTLRFALTTSLLTLQNVGSVGREGGKALASPLARGGIDALFRSPLPPAQPTQPTLALSPRALESVGSGFGHPTRRLHLPPVPNARLLGCRIASGSRPASRRSPSAFRAEDAPRTGHLAGPRTICPYQGSPPGAKSCPRPPAARTAGSQAAFRSLSLSMRKERAL